MDFLVYFEDGISFHFRYSFSHSYIKYIIYIYVYIERIVHYSLEKVEGGKYNFEGKFLYLNIYKIKYFL